MKPKLLSCLPSIRWVPHDIPTDSASTSNARRPKQFLLKRPKSRNVSPTPPMHRRKSTLSITSEPDPELDARTHEQQQSIFFKKLPLELRVMVYEWVMGEEVVHLTLSAKERFGHFLCEEEGAREDGVEWDCECKVLVGGGRNTRRLPRWVLGFLTTCRRMYSEAIPYLYRPHTFSILNITHLLFLPSRLPSARVCQLRTLRLRWSIRALPYFRRSLNNKQNKLAYPEDTVNWDRAWQIIASMKGLKTLYIVLSDPAGIWEDRWLGLEGELLEPVKSVRQTRVFELWLPYASCRVDWDLGGNCKLMKPQGENEQGLGEE